MVRRLHVALVAVFSLVLACGDLTGTSEDVGELSFRYDGAESGRFSAEGARPADWGSRSHAAGLRSESLRIVKIFAYAVGEGGTADQFVLQADSVSGTGSYPLAADHQEGAFQAELALDAVKAENSARAIYVLTAGSVTLEEVGGDRIRGRFEGMARLLGENATIQIRDGTFDVPNNLPRPVP